MNHVLSASNLRFLDIISYPEIRIERNKTTFICGESGCGKSTLLKLFNATVSPADGNIYFNGTDIETINTIQLRRKVLLCAQEPYLFDGSVKECFNEFYEYREAPPLSDSQIKKYLAICCAEFPLEAQCTNLSGGERQRVFLAICLSFCPEVLLMDEPTSALDTVTANLLLKQLKEHCIKEGITLVIVSHDRELSEAYADSIIKLSPHS